MGMIAEKYVMRAPLRKSGTEGPGTLAMAQLAGGALRPAPSSSLPSILPVIARVAAGACVPMSVSSRAPMARATTFEAAVWARMKARRRTGSAMLTPSFRQTQRTVGFSPTFSRT
jgi:hypothetical protein